MLGFVGVKLLILSVSLVAYGIADRVTVMYYGRLVSSF